MRKKKALSRTTHFTERHVRNVHTGVHASAVPSACPSLPTSTHLRSLPPVILLRVRSRIRIRAGTHAYTQMKPVPSAHGRLRARSFRDRHGLADASRCTTPPRHTSAVRQLSSTKPCWHRPHSFRLSVPCELLFVLLCLSCCIAFIHTLRLSPRFS